MPKQIHQLLLEAADFSFKDDLSLTKELKQLPNNFVFQGLTDPSSTQKIMSQIIERLNKWKIEYANVAQFSKYDGFQGQDTLFQRQIVYQLILIILKLNNITQQNERGQLEVIKKEIEKLFLTYHLYSYDKVNDNRIWMQYIFALFNQMLFNDKIDPNKAGFYSLGNTTILSSGLRNLFGLIINKFSKDRDHKDGDKERLEHFVALFFIEKISQINIWKQYAQHKFGGYGFGYNGDYALAVITMDDEILYTELMQKDKISLKIMRSASEKIYEEAFRKKLPIDSNTDNTTATTNYLHMIPYFGVKSKLENNTISEIKHQFDVRTEPDDIHNDIAKVLFGEPDAQEFDEATLNSAISSAPKKNNCH